MAAAAWLCACRDALAMDGDESRYLDAILGLSKPVWIPNIQPDFNVRVLERFRPDSLAVLRELDESNRFAQKSAESTLI